MILHKFISGTIADIQSTATGPLKIDFDIGITATNLDSMNEDGNIHVHGQSLNRVKFSVTLE